MVIYGVLNVSILKSFEKINAFVGRKEGRKVPWVVGSIIHGGLIELFLVPASAPRLV